MEKLPDSTPHFDQNGKEIERKNSALFFETICSLIASYHDLEKTAGDQIDLTAFLAKTLNQLKSHKSVELLNSLFDDKILSGYLNLSRELLNIYLDQAEYE